MMKWQDGKGERNGRRTTRHISRISKSPFLSSPFTAPPSFVYFWLPFLLIFGGGRGLNFGISEPANNAPYWGWGEIVVMFLLHLKTLLKPIKTPIKRQIRRHPAIIQQERAASTDTYRLGGKSFPGGRNTKCLFTSRETHYKLQSALVKYRQSRGGDRQEADMYRWINLRFFFDILSLSLFLSIFIHSLFSPIYTDRPTSPLYLPS